jgi:hypothetical protein
MEKIDQLFISEINRVLTTFPSIYSNNDVVSLLENLKITIIDELSKTPPVTNQHDVDAIARGVLDIIDNFDFEEFISYEPELCGSWGSSYSLEINTSFDDYQFSRQIERDVTDYFKDLNNENNNEKTEE